jgi:hypothetical protein
MGHQWGYEAAEAQSSSLTRDETRVRSPAAISPLRGGLTPEGETERGSGGWWRRCRSTWGSDLEPGAALVLPGGEVVGGEEMSRRSMAESGPKGLTSSSGLNYLAVYSSQRLPKFSGHLRRI